MEEKNTEPVKEEKTTEEKTNTTNEKKDTVETTVTEQTNEISNEKPKKKSKTGLIILIVVLGLGLVSALLLIGPLAYLFASKEKTEKVVTEKEEVFSSEYKMSGNSLENFDLAFLKLENNSKNEVYSPISIKYVLEMLAEGAKGDTKKQLDAVIGDYVSNKYTNSSNMSFANALFVKEAFKESVNKAYSEALQEKYGAEVIYDSFQTPDKLNSWVNNKTLGLINNVTDDVSKFDFMLVNALAIDMNWNYKIQESSSNPDIPDKYYNVKYSHEDYATSITTITGERDYHQLEFDNNKLKAKSVEIGASINNYDIVKTLGEENIRKNIIEKFTEWVKNNPNEAESVYSEEERKPEVYVEQYIKGLNSNYKRVDTSTDFTFYTDDNVKVFAKDLKEYDGTTLQYVGIMPKETELETFIKDNDAASIQKLINSLKTVESKSFDEGKVYKIIGYIPLFKMDYKLNLIDDLKSMGIENVFDKNKSDLTNIAKDASITEAIHQANIEFSNEGIKAAGVAYGGGAGAATAGFEYLYEVPVEIIDLTFDKPFMFLIRDKKTGEVWFAGTVYEPIEMK